MKPATILALIVCSISTMPLVAQESQKNQFHFDSLLCIESAKRFPFVGKLGLDQNYPNPFSISQETVITYKAINSSSASIIVYSQEGKQVLSSNLKSGVGTFRLHGSDLAAGAYIYALVVNGRVVARRRLEVKQ
jgi:hypothetical protein